MTMLRREWKPFLSQPPYNSKWWRLISGGGVSPCIAGSPKYCIDGKSALANCVGWAWGRVAMSEDNPTCKIGCWKGNGYPSNAENWLKASVQQGYEIGTKPELGAVAVWLHNSGEWGHLGVVEVLNPDGSWVSSESKWGGEYFLTEKYNSKSTKKNYKFLGFVLPKYEFYIPEEKELKVGDIVEIVSTGNGSSYGTANTAYGIGFKRKILKIYECRPYPYRVGNESGTTGFYKKDALRII